jgi:hypothetical protein
VILRSFLFQYNEYSERWQPYHFKHLYQRISLLSFKLMTLINFIDIPWR